MAQDDDVKRARRAELNRQLRQAFIEGAEERSRRELGRGLTPAELKRILKRYPGDLPDRWLSVRTRTCMTAPVE